MKNALIYEVSKASIRPFIDLYILIQCISELTTVVFFLQSRDKVIFITLINKLSMTTHTLSHYIQYNVEQTWTQKACGLTFC